MKTLRILTAGMVFLALLVFSQAAKSWAHEAEHSKVDIQMLRDSAEALKATHPDLAEKLSHFADYEAREASEEDEEREENEKK